MKVVLDISEKEIKRLNEAVDFIEDVENVDEYEIEMAIHTLIDVCM